MKRRDLPSDPMEDSQRLVNELLPMTKTLLERYGEFFPMGAKMGAEGEIEQVSASEGSDQTNPLVLAELLRQAFAVHAERGELRASAVIQDLSVQEQGRERRADAVSIEIEHFTGYNVIMIVPYRRLDGHVMFGAPVVSNGIHRIFPRRKG